MADLSSITLPSGVKYDIKDTQARIDIAALQQADIDVDKAEAAAIQAESAADRAETAASEAELKSIGVTVIDTVLIIAPIAPAVAVEDTVLVFPPTE